MKAVYFTLVFISPHITRATPPRFRFLTKVYHPNVDADGNISVDKIGAHWG